MKYKSATKDKKTHDLTLLLWVGVYLGKNEHVSES